jgi:hypothetical protein
MWIACSFSLMDIVLCVCVCPDVHVRFLFSFKMEIVYDVHPCFQSPNPQKRNPKRKTIELPLQIRQDVKNDDIFTIICPNSIDPRYSLQACIEGRLIQEELVEDSRAPKKNQIRTSDII